MMSSYSCPSLTSTRSIGRGGQARHQRRWATRGEELELANCGDEHVGDVILLAQGLRLRSK
jgi:hypothetical protein